MDFQPSWRPTSTYAKTFDVLATKELKRTISRLMVLDVPKIHDDIGGRMKAYGS
jgi:hypothetical protein